MPYTVNRHFFVYVEGVGPPPKKKPTKGKNYLPSPWLYVGRGSPLGNPYRPHSGGHAGEVLSHDGALELYRRWLWERIRGNHYATLLAMHSIEANTALVCSCAPKRCHADIIVRAWEWMVGQRMIVLVV